MDFQIDRARHAMIIGHEVDLEKSHLEDVRNRLEAATNPLARIAGKFAVRRSLKRLSYFQQELTAVMAGHNIKDDLEIPQGE